jgi:hypothetical protein
MRRLLSLLLTPALLTACELDFTGIGDALVQAYCAGPCYEPTPTLSVSGTVWVGSYRADDGETTILLYSPSDTVAPADSTLVHFGGGYWRDFGPSPAPAVCDYLARAVLWTGEVTGLEPLFPTDGDCQPSLATVSGPAFHLPAYPPLLEPFVISGSVRIDGRPARSGEVTLASPLRAPDGSQEQRFTTDDNGEWRVEATDRAQRYSLCRRVWVLAWQGGVIVDDASLEAPANGMCVSGRRLPDIRIGTRLAAVGSVRRGASPSPLEPVGEGAANVSLASPADSSLVGEVFETHDDGSFHVWFPHEMPDPGCDWLLRAEVADQIQYRRLLPDGAASCQPRFYHDFDFTTG